MPLSRTLSIPFILSVFFPSSLGAIGPTADLDISNIDASPDGFDRTSISAGGNVTGVLITGNRGDEFQINVVNNLSDDTMLESTSIHWHGLFQSGTNYQDGGAFVNQCPIVAGDSYLYDFSSADQAGTFWYHSHFSTQYCDGLRGPLVVYDPDDPHADLYDVDDESTVWTLQDWYHDVASSLTLPTPDSNLFNGLGRFDGGNATDLAVVTVTSGTRYRIRLVNMACDPNYTFQIDGHTMTIIEIDGVNVEPLEVDEIQIFAAQRYSFVLEANQDVDNYWIRFNPSVGTQGFDGGLNSAILRYDGADEVEPTTEQDTASNALVETSLVPLENPGAPGTAGSGNADINLNLDLAFDGTDLDFTINGETYTSPTVPVLLQLLSGAFAADELLPEGSIYYLERNQTVELSMPAGVAGGPHPIHLHGHAFDIVRAAGQTGYNYDNPPRRDTVSLGDNGDNVTIRFTADNPGPWFLHCHIDWHLELGFAIVFAEATDDWASSNAVSTAWDDLCPTYNASLSRRSLLGN